VHLGNVDAPFYVVCDRCNGRPLERAFENGELCLKCGGCGRIVITTTKPYTPMSVSQRATRQMAWVLFGATAASLLIIALLHWFKLI